MSGSVRSAIPVERPVGPLSSWQDRFLPLLWGQVLDEELFARIGALLNVSSRVILKSAKLPGVQDLQLVIHHASGDRYEEAEALLRSACDADVHPVILELGAMFNRYVRGHLQPQFLPGSPEWKENQQAFARALMDLLNARIATEKAHREEKAKGQQDAPGDMAHLCTRLLPKVAELEADLKLLAQIVARQDGLEAGSIRQNFVVPLEKLHRFVEKRIKE